MTWTVQRLAAALAEHAAAGRGDDIVFITVTPPRKRDRKKDWWNRREITVEDVSWAAGDDAFFIIEGTAS